MPDAVTDECRDGCCDWCCHRARFAAARRAQSRPRRPDAALGHHDDSSDPRRLRAGRMPPGAVPLTVPPTVPPIVPLYWPCTPTAHRAAHRKPPAASLDRRTTHRTACNPVPPDASSSSATAACWPSPSSSTAISTLFIIYYLFGPLRLGPNFAQIS